MEESVIALFDISENMLWKRSFKGRMDDINDIGIVLGFDGKTCRGKMRYLRSAETLELRGTWSGGRFQLDEVDSFGNITGKLEGSINSNILQAAWSNVDNTIGRKVMLAEVAKVDNLPTHCGDNKWLRFYKAADKGNEMELLLQKGSNNQVWGIAYYLNRSFKVQGQIDSLNYLDLSLRKASNNHLGNIRAADFIGSKNFTAVFSRNDNHEQTFYFQLTGQLAMDCLEFADYVSNYDIVFPKTTNAPFNEWMGTKAAEWAASCRLQAKRNEIGQTPATRASQSASGWCEIEYFTDDLISGFISGRTSWKRGQQDFSFNFDLKKGVEIRPKDIFKDLFDPSSFVQTIVKSAFKKHALYESDEGFRKWIDSAAFPFYTIRKEGICFSTEFNILYGRQSMTVPYSELKPYLKENSPLKGLVMQ